MSLQRIRQVFEKLDACAGWEIQLLNSRIVQGKTAYNAQDINVITPDAVRDFVSGLAKTYRKERGKLSEYEEVCAYDGSSIGRKIYRLEASDPLICESCEKLESAMENPDMQGNALEFPANAYVLKGRVWEEEENVDVKLFTLISPFILLKHAFAWDGESFKAIPDKYLSLRGYVEVLMLDQTVYMFRMNGEKLFQMERAYRTICRNKVEDVIADKIVSDVKTFRKIATTGYNPRRFVAFNESALKRFKEDSDFKSRIAEKFDIELTKEGEVESSDEKNVNRFVKFLCKRGMIDPVSEDPVETEGARKWK